MMLYTPLSFSVRPMSKEDIKTPERWTTRVKSIESDFRNEDMLGFVAIHEEKIIGYVGLELIAEDTVFSSQNIPEIVELYVFKLYRNKGVATALIHLCEKAALEGGYPIVGLSVGIDAEDAPAQRLYTKLGYVPIEGLSENWRLTLCKKLA